MNPLLQLFSCYKKDLKLEDNLFCMLFEKLLSGSPCSIFEFAPQITPAGIHAARFRVGYLKEDVKEGLKAIFLILDEISGCDNVSLNRIILDQIVDSSFNLSKIAKLGMGIDIRENSQNSKVKCYFQSIDYPDKIDQVLAIHPPIESINYYPSNDLFGINIYFDGRTDVEIYPSLGQQDIKNTALMEKLKLQNIPNYFLKESKILFVSFEGRSKRVFHFYTQAPTGFVRMIGSRELTELYGNAQIIHRIIDRADGIGPLRVIIALLEDEIYSENVEHINPAFYHQIS